MSTIARAVLTSGTAHDDTHELGRMLAAAGYPNSVSRGENAFGIVDESILTAAQAFRAAYDVPEEDTIPGVPAHERSRWVGPRLWDALLTPQGNPRKFKTA